MIFAYPQAQGKLWGFLRRNSPRLAGQRVVRGVAQCCLECGGEAWPGSRMLCRVLHGVVHTVAVKPGKCATRM